MKELFVFVEVHVKAGVKKKIQAAEMEKKN